MQTIVKHLTLVPQDDEPPASPETIAALRKLLSEALSPKPPEEPLIGLAYVAVYENGYMVNAVGEANARAQLVRGLITELDDLMRERIRLTRKPR